MLQNEIQPVQKENFFHDTRRLVIVDSSNLIPSNSQNTELTETIMLNKTKENYISFTNHLFELLKNQQGNDKEDIDYDKSPDELTLPEPIITLPRSLPIPVSKPLTKWEKYKKEKGIIQRKRSRMVYSEAVNDWVPRWGKGSKKQIDDKLNWVMEEKQHGVNPFEQKSNEKQLAKLKQQKRQAKNEEYAGKVLNKNNSENNVNKSKLSKKQVKALKSMKELKKLGDEKKNLSKRLEQVQKSTRSMGNFDKKLKNEKELNLIKKKRVSNDILMDKSKEKSRDKRILDSILKTKK